MHAEETPAAAPSLQNDVVKILTSDNFQNKLGNKGLRSLSERIKGGELIRTIGTVPFGVQTADANAFIAAGIKISADLAENMASISKGFEEYQQIKLLKKPIQLTYFITLSIVALLVVFCAV